MKIVKIAPGQVLEYPALEQARTRLKKAGFQLATVEVLPSEFDSLYKDILVKVEEKER